MDALTQLQAAVTALSCRLDKLEQAKPGQPVDICCPRHEERLVAVASLKAKGMSKSQIARALGISEQATYRALRKLRQNANQNS
jgi:DNA-binding NarL/FixJ family response regulator